MSVNCRRRNLTFSRSARSRIFAFCGADDEAGGFAGMRVVLRFLRASHETVHALQNSRAFAARLPLETRRVYFTLCTPSPESPFPANGGCAESDPTRTQLARRADRRGSGDSSPMEALGMRTFLGIAAGLTLASGVALVAASDQQVVKERRVEQAPPSWSESGADDLVGQPM